MSFKDIHYMGHDEIHNTVQQAVDSSMGSLKRDVERILKVLEGNGKIGLVKEHQELETKVEVLETKQNECPARMSSSTSNKALRIQKISAVISVITALILLSSLLVTFMTKGT